MFFEFTVILAKLKKKVVSLTFILFNHLIIPQSFKQNRYEIYNLIFSRFFIEFTQLQQVNFNFLIKKVIYHFFQIHFLI